MTYSRREQWVRQLASMEGNAFLMLGPRCNALVGRAALGFLRGSPLRRH